MATTLAPLDVNAVRSRFPLLMQPAQGKPLAYLDTAASAQKPDVVIDAIAGYYRHDNANVHRGLYDLARRATDRYEAARQTIARYINAPSAAGIVFVRGTTEAINLVASSWGGSNLRERDEIVISIMEHHSNFVPWQLIARQTGAVLRHIEIDDEGRLRLDHLRSLLGPRTRVVAVGHISNALGTIHPVREICELAHEAGAIAVIDGAQGAPHLDIDVQSIGCDFYAFSGHKMCGPMGIGALWGRTEWFEQMQPYQGGGEMIDTVELDHSTWASVPHKFEAGTPNVGGAIGMAAAADFLTGLGFENIARHEQEMVRYGLDRLGRVAGLRMFGPHDAEQRIAIFSFALDGVHPHDVATVLDADNVAVRAGHHCAQPLMRRLGVPATTRASLYLYNSTDEIDRLADGLEKARMIFGL